MQELLPLVFLEKNVMCVIYFHKIKNNALLEYQELYQMKAFKDFLTLLQLKSVIERWFASTIYC